MSYKIRGPLHPIDDKSIIVERDELKTALNHLRQGRYYIALESPRQTGKTTLLSQMLVALDDESAAGALLYLEDLDEREFYQSLCKDIARQFDDVIKATDPYPVSEIQGQEGFRDYLGWISQHTPNTQRLVLMLDEVGGVPDELSPRFFGGFRRIFTQVAIESHDDDRRTYGKWSFVFSGALDMRNVAGSESSPLFNACIQLKLKEFSEEQTRKLVNQLPSLGDEARAALTKAVYAWTNGHPYLTQKVCMLIEESDEYRNQNIIDAEDLVKQLVQHEIVERWSDDTNISHLFRHLTDEQGYQQFLRDLLGQKKKKADAIAVDLESIGFITWEEDTYVIRNRIYREALELYFGDSLQTSGVRSKPQIPTELRASYDIISQIAERAAEETAEKIKAKAFQEPILDNINGFATVLIKDEESEETLEKDKSDKYVLRHKHKYTLEIGLHSSRLESGECEVIDISDGRDVNETSFTVELEIAGISGGMEINPDRMDLRVNPSKDFHVSQTCVIQPIEKGDYTLYVSFFQRNRSIQLAILELAVKRR